MRSVVSLLLLVTLSVNLVAHALMCEGIVLRGLWPSFR